MFMMGSSSVSIRLLIFFVFCFAPIAGYSDLFIDDGINRTVMTESERRLPAVQVGRMSGVLLSESLLLTARHVIKNWEQYEYNGSTLFSGPSGERSYFKFVSILEENPNSDYAIVQIAWKNHIPPPGLQWVKDIVMPNSLTPNKVHPIEIFVLGCPWDKIPNPMRSNGTQVALLSDPEIQFPLFFNAGAVEGNSGGPIFTSQGKLLGIVIGGRHQLGEDGYKDNDPNDIKAWNWGTPLSRIYPDSKILQKLFPQQPHTQNSQTGL